LLVCREDLTRIGLSEAQLEKVNLVLLDTQTSATASHADVQLPALTVFEKNGTFVNLNFRLQKFSQAVPGPAGLLPDTLILSKMLSTLTGESFPDCPATIWKSLSQSNSNFKGIDFSSIPTDGIQLEKSAFDHIDFPEKQSLKYSPAAITG
ncbi:MAG: molybdopterin-dependent oxidoreductase, partial [Opitutae bacterium]